MNNFSIVYKILSYLERAMDLKKVDLTAMREELDVSSDVLIELLFALSRKGYVTLTPWPQITFEGLQYLQYMNGQTN